MQQVIRDYIAAMKNSVKASKEMHDLADRLTKAGKGAAVGMWKQASDTNLAITKEAAKAAFVEFLKGDGNKDQILAKFHGHEFSAAEDADQAHGTKLAPAVRMLRETEFAAWYAHKKLVEAMIKGEVNGDHPRLRELLYDRAVFNLYEVMSFADFWAEVFPEAAE